MNKAFYKVIFNQRRGCMMAVAENVKREGKSVADTQDKNHSAHISAGFVQTFSILSFSVSMILGAASIAFADGIIADQYAPGHQQPTILKTANGTPQINIQTPTQAGVSVNQYRQFDVNGKGVILNNSRSSVQTQLGGWIQGNPWLAAGGAEVIVNQVNSPNPALLNGYIEIGGRKAEVVIANPAGIQVNGAGFINAAGVTLTTGRPIFDNGRLSGFQVRDGRIAVHGGGLDTSTADYTRILTRAAQINAGIWAKDLSVVSGGNDVAADGSYTAVSDGSPVPAIAIDSSQLGGMYAGKIVLISGDKGAAIQNAGQIFASAGGVILDAAGNLANSGTVASQQRTQIQTQSMQNSGVLLSSGELDLRHSGSLTNRKTGQIQAARLAIQAAQLDNAGSIAQTGNQKFNIDIHDTARNQGRIGSPDKPPAASNGSGSDTGHHEDQSQKTVPIVPTAATGAGKATVSSDNATLPNLADGTLEVRGMLNNSGSIIANGQTYAVARQGLNNAGQMDIHQLDVQGPAFDNHNGTLISDTAHIQTGRLNNQNGNITIRRQLTVETARFNNADGKLLSAGEARLAVSDGLSNEKQGQIQAGHLNLQAADLDNAGNITGENDSNLTIQNRLRNAGSIAVRRFAAKGQVLDNMQGQIAVENADIQSRELINRSGNITADGQLTVRSRHTDNRNGKLLSVNRAELTLSDSLSNQGGTIAANRQLFIGNGQNRTLAVDNTGGTIQSGGNVSIQAKSLANNGTLSAADRLNIALQDDFSVERDIIAGGGLSLNTQGSLTNTRTLQAGEQLYIQAANIHNDVQGSIRSGGITDIDVRQNLDNRGLIDGQRTQIRAEQLRNTGTGRIYGNRLSVAANRLDNQDENGKGAAIAAREELNLGIARLNNRENSLIYSGGHMAVGGTLDAQGQAAGKAQSIHNASAVIEAAGGIRLNVQTLRNTNEHLQTRLVETGREHIVDYEAFGRHELLREGTQQALGWFVYNDESDHLRTPDGATHNQWHKYDYEKVTQETRVTQTAPAKIISGGDLSIDAGEVFNQDSQVIAGGNLLVAAGPGGLHNEQTFGEKKVFSENGKLHRYWRAKRRGRDTTGYSRQDYTLPSEITRNTPLGSFAYEAYRNALSHQAPNPGTGLEADNWDHIRSAQRNPLSFPDQAGRFVRLPNSSLFTVNPANKGYIVETDPRFAGYRQWLGSDYMLAHLKTDPNNLHKRLGDGYYEQRFINEQIAELTGYRRLDGYRSDEEQFKALMDNGAAAARSMNLSIGVALSAEQVAQLTSDIVWPVRKEVQLPDGSIETVLVPQVYMRVKNGDIDGQGALLSGSHTRLNVSGRLKNSDTVAGRNELIIHTDTLDNTGGRVHARQAAVSAVQDINNIGGTLSARDTLLLQAGGNINSRSTTARSQNAQGSSTYLERVTGIYITGKQDGMLAVQAGNDINLTAAQIRNQSEQGQTRIQAGRDINLDTVQTGRHQETRFDADNRIIRGSTNEIGSSIQTQGSIALLAGNNLNARAAEVGSANGTLAAIARNDININAGIDSTSADDASKHKGRSGGGNKLVITDTVRNRSETAQSSTFDGKHVILEAGHNTAVSGSNIISDNGTRIQAGNNVLIGTAETRSRSETHHQTQKSGLMRSGTGLSIGSKKETADAQSQSIEHTGSTVGSLKGGTDILAGRQYRQTGSSVSSPEGNTLIAAQSIDIEAARNRFDSQTDRTYEQNGLTVSLSTPVTDLAQQIHSVVQSSRQIGQSKNSRVNAMAAANAGRQAYQAGKSAQNMAGKSQSAANQVSISITYGEQKNRQTTQIQANEAQASQIQSGGTTTLIATGAAEQSDINITGSDVAGKAGTLLIADHNINLQSAEQTGSERSKNQSQGWNAGAAVTFGQGSWSLGITAGGNIGRGYGNGDSLTHRHSRIGGTDGQTVLRSGGSTTLKGAQAAGRGVQIDARNLHIESVQDTGTYRGRQQNADLQITAGYGVSASGSYSQSSISADHASVSEQSGIFAGDDGYQINVGAHTGLKGGLITSAQTAADNGSNRFGTGTLTSADIRNHSRYEGKSFGLDGSAKAGGRTLGQGADNNPAQSRLTTVADKNGMGSTIGYGSDSGNQNSMTRSGINTRNITIADEAAQTALTGQTAEQTKAQIYTGTATDTAEQHTGRLKNVFDRERVENELNLQRTVSRNFNQNIQAANAEINKHLDGLKDQLEKGEISQTEYDSKVSNWQQGQVLLNSIASGLAAPVQSVSGIAAAAASPAAAYSIGQYFKSLAGQNKNGKLTAQQETARILSHAVLGAAVAASGGNDALAGALGAGGAEAAAPVLGRWLYGEADGSQLTAEQKATVAGITNLLGTAAGAAAGNSTADAAQGSLNAQNAVENNHLRKGQRSIKKAELRSCKGDYLCELKVDKKWEQIGLQNLRELYVACDKGINTAECNNLRNQIDTSTYQGKRDYNYPTGLEINGEVVAAIGVGAQVNGKITVSLGNRGSSVQAEGGIGLGIGAALSGGLSRQTRRFDIDENKALNISTEIVLGEKQFGTQANNSNATLSTKAEAEIKLGPWNNSFVIQGGRQYTDNQASSLYMGGEIKSSVKPQLGIGGMLRWDIWNGKSKRYEKIKQ
ncbi:hemagglutinin repeat-containing protein [Neisseria leonii]|uniref:two-partner secretion domain-containing protein n=1 Tax=Neisseria leonii TaxID=2995413 RepID=UPI0030D404CF